MACGNFLRINGSRKILNFADFKVPKIVLHSKIIDKTRAKERSRKFLTSDKSSRKTSAGPV